MVQTTRVTRTLLLSLLACSPQRDPAELFGPAEVGVLVVDAQLIVGEPLPEVFLRRTAAPGATYEAVDQGVLTADMVIRYTNGETVYRADPDSAGRFLPAGDTPLVAPRALYELSVAVGEEHLSAQTRTPGSVRVREAVLLDVGSLEIRRHLALFGASSDVFAAQENQVVYQDGVLEVRTDIVQDAAGYQLALFSLDLESDFVIDADFLEADDYAEFERQGSSPVLDGADGRIRLPWFAVAFAGRYIWRTYVLDRNWYDFARTDPEDGGGFGGLAGDSFQRPSFHVEGGIGLFGSAAVDSVGFVVAPRPEP